MLAYVTCPNCQNKLAIPEGQMGKRHTCPQCQSLFLAGRSDQPAASMLAQEQLAPAPAPAAPVNKTMLGQTEPPIRYSCPRCKKPLEDPATEVGTKKPCPFCGQRVQVPAPPPPVTNKTMLGQQEGAPLAGVPMGQAAPYPAGPGHAQDLHCLECGRDMTGWDQLLTCQDCGSRFCSSGCIREHRYHAHERRRDRPPPPRDYEPPPPDNTGLIIGLTVGGIFFVFLVIFLLVSVRW